MRVRFGVLAAVWVALGALEMQAKSVYPLRPEDPHAVYLEKGAFGAHADGLADDADALQAAIDRVQETTGAGVVFLKQGHYRLGKTVYLWTGIRVIGYGAERPVLTLAPNTPGFQEGHGFLGTGRYMVQFASQRPAAGAPVVDANEFTFYSGMSNVDFEIGEGNPAAIAVRFHVAQHSTLSHMDFRIGSARAAIEDVGNQASDLKITGGEYGIISVRTAPAWQFLLMDSIIESPRKAAIHTQEVGMTLVRVRMAHAPVAVEITEGMPEQLYGRDLVLEDIHRSAVMVGNVWSAHSQITLDHVVCSDVTKMLEHGEGAAGWNEIKAPAKYWMEEKLTLGLEIGPDGREAGYALRHKESRLSKIPALAKTDIADLPSMAAWVNVHTLGVKGDGGTDDTPALQKAIDSHRVLYLPSGMYRMTGTLHLRPETVLIGMNPITTQLTLWDEEPAFGKEGSATPVVESARGGNPMLVSIGVATGEMNPGAAGVVWKAGPRSVMDDVNFMRGRGRPNSPLNGGVPADKRPKPHGEAYVDTEYPSLWVKDGGGGLFRGIWTANTIARAGLLVENTATPSIVYQMSCEHHMRYETRFHQAQNWTIYALQTEEEKPDGADAFAVELLGSQHFTFANLFMYRVSRNVTPKLNALEAKNSSDIRLENVHDFSMMRLAYDNSIWDATSGVRVRAHDFTVFSITPQLRQAAPAPLPAGVFEKDARPEQLANGFSNVAGLTTDDAGTLYFTDAAAARILRWNAGAKKAELISQDVPDPRAVAWIKPGWLMAVDYAKAAYAVPTDGGKAEKLAEQAEPPANARALIAAGFHTAVETQERQLAHSGYLYAPRSNMAVTGFTTDEHRGHFNLPGSSTTLVAGGTWQPYLQASQLRTIAVGEETFIVSEDDDKVYRVKLENLRTLSKNVFAQRGGTSVVADSAGNVYVAAGEVYVYNAAGKQIGVLETPERPSSLAFGGPDRKTLYIGARGGLYAIRTLAAGH